MKRIIGALAGAAAIGLSIVGTAQAATPLVHTRGVTQVTGTTAVLNGAVNAKGAATSYVFNYGPTTSFGTATVAGDAGQGARRIFVHQQITGLTPGTTYYAELSAVSAGGSATGNTVSFTTAGHPPSSVFTGPADNVYKQQALLTGAINPNGGTTTWYVQYGSTTGYGLQTAPQTLAAGTTAVPVSVTLTALAPAKLYHYRVVAAHGKVVSYGADEEFFTQPQKAPSAGLHTRTSPSSDSGKPFRFTTSGSLGGGKYILAAQRCSGTVGIRYYNGSRQLAYVVAGVGSDCKFSGSVSFNKTHGSGKVALRVTVSYRGNGYLAPQHKTDHVTVGAKHS